MSSGSQAEHIEPTDVLQVVPTNIPEPDTNTSMDPNTSATLKRRASSTFEDTEERSSRKKLKEDDEQFRDPSGPTEMNPVDGDALADELEQELQCGCCSALVYRPVIVSPCQHFFCGRSANL